MSSPRAEIGSAEVKSGVAAKGLGLTRRYNEKARAKAAGCTTNQPRALPEPPAGAAGAGRAQGRTPSDHKRPKMPTAGVGAPAQGRSTEQQSPGGKGEKKAAKSRLTPPGLEPPGPEAPKGASQGEPATPERSNAEPRSGSGGRPPHAGRPEQPKGQGGCRGRCPPRRAKARTRGAALKPGAGEADQKAAGAPPRTGPGTQPKGSGLSGDGEWAKRRAGKSGGTNAPLARGAYLCAKRPKGAGAIVEGVGGRQRQKGGGLAKRTAPRRPPAGSHDNSPANSFAGYGVAVGVAGACLLFASWPRQPKAEP